MSIVKKKYANNLGGMDDFTPCQKCKQYNANPDKDNTCYRCYITSKNLWNRWNIHLSPYYEQEVEDWLKQVQGDNRLNAAKFQELKSFLDKKVEHWSPTKVYYYLFGNQIRLTYQQAQELNQMYAQYGPKDKGTSQELRFFLFSRVWEYWKVGKHDFGHSHLLHDFSQPGCVMDIKERYLKTEQVVEAYINAKKYLKGTIDFTKVECCQDIHPPSSSE